ncbi:MAG: GNAT family N-acetyltransferase [bacterium]
MSSNCTSDPSQHEWSVRLTTWQGDRTGLESVRRKVFINEQSVPEAMEWDTIDLHCLHAIAKDSEGNAIGTARLRPDGKIGRMAVLSQWRSKGIGSALLNLLLGVTTRPHFPTPFLDAQVHAIAFYEKHGFTPFGEVFMDAGIPHKKMRLKKSHQL